MSPYPFIVLYAVALLAVAMVLNYGKYRTHKVQLKRIKEIHGSKNKFEQLRNEFRSLLIDNDVSNQWLIGMMVLCAFGGLAIGKFMYSRSFLAIAMSICSAFLPFAFLNVMSEKHKHDVLAKLESSMLCITTGYLIEQDLTKVVRESLCNLEYPKPFQEFVTETTYIDANVTKALHKLKRSIHNVYFSQWIDVLIQSQYDYGTAPYAMVIVRQMNSVKRKNEESDAHLFADWNGFFTGVAIVFAVPLLLRIFMFEWYKTLVETTGGVILCLMTIAGLVFAVLRALSINRKLS